MPGNAGVLPPSRRHYQDQTVTGIVSGPSRGHALVDTHTILTRNSGWPSYQDAHFPGEMTKARGWAM